MPANSDILESCSCSVVSPKLNDMFQKPYLYIAFVQNYISKYQFHYKHEHCEDSVSKIFLTKFLVSIIDILNTLRRQVLFYDNYVIKPFGDSRQITESIQVCGDLIFRLNKIERVPKQIIIDLLTFLKEVFNVWESYVFQNAILSFV